MNPKPFASLNHFTFPFVATWVYTSTVLKIPGTLGAYRLDKAHKGYYIPSAGQGLNLPYLGPLGPLKLTFLLQKIHCFETNYP